MKKIISLSLLVVLMMALFIGCDKVDSDKVTYNKLINCTYVSQESKSEGKLTYYYVIVKYQDKDMKLEMDYDIYDNLKNLQKANIALNNDLPLKLSIIYNTVKNYVYGIAVDKGESK